jgi:hypothetical protein
MKWTAAKPAHRSSSHMVAPPANDYRNYIYKYDRWYHSAGDMKYLIPCDEVCILFDNADSVRKLTLNAAREGPFRYFPQDFS